MVLDRKHSEIEPPTIALNRFDSVHFGKSIKLQEGKAPKKSFVEMQESTGLTDQIRELQKKTLVGAVATKKQMFAIYHLIIN